MITLYIIICIILFFIGFLLGRKNNIIIHNEDDIKKGMELERRNKKFRDYLDSYYSDTIPPIGVAEEGYRKIRKEVLGHY